MTDAVTSIERALADMVRAARRDSRNSGGWDDVNFAVSLLRRIASDPPAEMVASCLPSTQEPTLADKQAGAAICAMLPPLTGPHAGMGVTIAAEMVRDARAMFTWLADKLETTDGS